MARPIAKAFMGFFLVAILFVALVVVVTLSQPAVPSRSLPKPNGYDDFVKAGQMVSGYASEAPGMSEAGLRKFVGTNSEALKAAQEGFKHECLAPLDYSPTNLVHLGDFGAIKRLAQTLVAEGRLAELEYRPGAAAESYVAAVRLGQEATRGGTIIHSLVAIAIQAVGIVPLERLVPKLDASQSREAAAALEGMESRREPEKTILDQERGWIRRAYGFKGPWLRLVAYKSIRQTEQKWSARLRSHETRVRLLLIQLAARAYELDKGERPKNLADLVPGYLKAIPQDPLTGTNMTYRP